MITENTGYISPLKQTYILILYCSKRSKILTKVFRMLKRLSAHAPARGRPECEFWLHHLTALTLSTFSSSLILVAAENSYDLPPGADTRINPWQCTHGVSSAPGRAQSTQQIFGVSFKSLTVTTVIPPLWESVHKDNTHPRGCFLHLVLFSSLLKFYSWIKLKSTQKALQKSYHKDFKLIDKPQESYWYIGQNSSLLAMTAGHRMAVCNFWHSHHLPFKAACCHVRADDAITVTDLQKRITWRALL